MGRRIFTATTAVATFYSVSWIGLFFGSGFQDQERIWTLIWIVAVALAASVGYFVWTRTRSRPALVASAITGAVITGAIGFSAGFLGPIIFMPHARQGPLLGIFFTGPLGFIVGAVGGGVRWALREREK